jgi:hypothetical protein
MLTALTTTELSNQNEASSLLICVAMAMIFRIRVLNRKGPRKQFRPSTLSLVRELIVLQERSWVSSMRGRVL